MLLCKNTVFFFFSWTETFNNPKKKGRLSPYLPFLGIQHIYIFSRTKKAFTEKAILKGLHHFLPMFLASGNGITLVQAPEHSSEGYFVGSRMPRDW